MVKEDDTNTLYIELTYMFITGEEIAKDTSILIEVGELYTIQSLLEQSLFYLLGWQVMGTPQILDNDLAGEEKLANLSPFKKN